MFKLIETNGKMDDTYLKNPPVQLSWLLTGTNAKKKNYTDKEISEHLETNFMKLGILIPKG